MCSLPPARTARIRARTAPTPVMPVPLASRTRLNEARFEARRRVSGLGPREAGKWWSHGERWMYVPGPPVGVSNYSSLEVQGRPLSTPNRGPWYRLLMVGSRHRSKSTLVGAVGSKG